jgi:hypothetical protein
VIQFAIFVGKNVLSFQAVQWTWKRDRVEATNLGALFSSAKLFVADLFVVFCSSQLILPDLFSKKSSLWPCQPPKLPKKVEIVYFQTFDGKIKVCLLSSFVNMNKAYLCSRCHVRWTPSNLIFAPKSDSTFKNGPLGVMFKLKPDIILAFF